MANQWLFQPNPEEIQEKPAQEELFVFGYACRLFRDDEKARDVDNGRHLIPWMGDERLMIDRYDGRGHLYDLSAFDADNIKRELVLSEEEKQIEKLCDDERYLELRTDIAEKAMYEEEEWKRYYESLAEGYKAVGFSYEQFYDGSYSQMPLQDAPKEEEDEPYTPAPELQVPAGMVLPVAKRVNAIIEKTANFIVQHGGQMEIIIKTKQAANPQFDFLKFENELNPYFKHLVKMIKAGKYKPKIAEKENDDGQEEGGHTADGDHHGYLHPSLLTNRPSPAPSPTPEVYKPVPMPKVSIHETSYGQLLQSLTRANQQAAEKNRPKQVKVESPEDTKESSLPPFVAQPVYGPTHPGHPPPPGIEPVTLPPRSHHTDSDSVKEEPVESSVPGIVPPPPDVQPIIDRMAMYVAKNGVEFEIVVKSKKDPRFDFLQSWHVHFAYYDFKKELFIKEMEKEREEEERIKAEKAAALASKSVSFSIKAKTREQETATIEKKKKKPIFDYESSEEDHEGDTDSQREKTRSDVSGTSTPVTDDQSDQGRVELPPEVLEKKQAEQRLKDRLVASAREKLSQVDKEKQLQAERKRKAAMFLNMLKSTNQGMGDVSVDNSVSTETGATNSTASIESSPMQSDTSVNLEGPSSSRNRHKQAEKKSRNRSRSRSRSPSRHKSKKKRRRRSPTPPTAYAVRRSDSRSPIRCPPPPPPLPSRYGTSWRDPRSSSPSRSRSRTPTRSKSKKSKKSSRSDSPVRLKTSSSKSDSPSRKSSKKSKKRKSRSRSPSRRSKQSKSEKRKTVNGPEVSDQPNQENAGSENGVTEADEVNSEDRADTVADRLGGAVESEVEQDSDSRYSGITEDTESARQSPVSSIAPPPPPPPPFPPDMNDSQPEPEKPRAESPNVSQYMLSRVRAILKASREAILKEDGPLDDP